MYAYKSFAKQFRRESLVKTFYEKIAGKQTVGLDYVTADHFSQLIDDTVENNEIDVILRKVNSCTYKFTPYRQVLVSKGKGKPPRELNIPTVRDRLTLAALSKVLDDVYGLKCATPQPQSVISQVSETLRSRQYTHCIKGDLKTFYAKIPHDKLIRVLRRKIRKKELIELVNYAIKTPAASIGEKAVDKRHEGVPEGLSISNRLANIYASMLDSLYYGIPNILYFRYVDDILIFCDSIGATNGKEKLRLRVEDIGLKLNDDKTDVIKIGDKSIEYLGYLFDPSGKITVRHSTVLKLERTLDDELRQMRANQQRESCLLHLNNRITGCRVTEDGINFERYGWLHYYSRINDIELLCHLDSLMEKLKQRYSLTFSGKLKKFKKAFYEIKYKANTTSYIPTYDMRCPAHIKRDDLKALFPLENWDRKNDDEINRIYSFRIRKMASKLEKDVGLIS